MAFKLPNKVKSDQIVDSINDKFVGLKPKESFQIFNLKIDKALHKKFKAYCANNDLHMSDVVCDVIRDIVRNKE